MFPKKYKILGSSVFLGSGGVQERPGELGRARERPRAPGRPPESSRELRKSPFAFAFAHLIDSIEFIVLVDLIDLTDSIGLSEVMVRIYKLNLNSVK